MAVTELVAALGSTEALTWAGEAAPSDAAAIARVLSAALEPSYSVVPRHATRTALVHLDTVDGRLRRAGIGAVYSAADQTIAVVQPDGAGASQPIGRTRWPALVGALPEGPVRSTLAGPASIRALMPYASTRAECRTFAVLNEDAKTVVRLTWWASAADGSALLPRISVRPLRGYDKDARAVRRLLFETAPVVHDGTAWFDAVPRPDRRPERQRDSMRADDPAPNAVAAALLDYLDELEANVSGVLDDVDTEFLHDVRVAVRRTRSLIKVVGDVLALDTARAAAEFRWLGQVTTPTRDLDVYLLGVDELAASIANPADLVPFGEHLRRRRTAARRALVRQLRSERFAALCTWWRSELLRVRGGQAPSSPTAAQLADERLHREFRKVTKRARAITAESEADEIHALRKKCKELRYLLEVFEPICDRRAYKQVIADFKELQNVLGEFQDGEVQAIALRVFAQEMIDSGNAPASALLAMGDLAGRFDIRQRAARSELTARHDSYLGKSAAHHIDRLVAS
jgi:CHAD domain-containing protein